MNQLVLLTSVLVVCSIATDPIVNDSKNYLVRLRRAAEETKEEEEVVVNYCPTDYPNVYYNGQYCCKSNMEKFNKAQGAQCDGSVIQRDSLCCAGDKYTSCPGENCVSSGHKFTDGARISLGCWRDGWNRAISGGIRFTGSIEKCEKFAIDNSLKVFAVQNGECFTAEDAGQTYQKYGKAGNCKDGKGGGFANDVYQVGESQSRNDDGIVENPVKNAKYSLGKDFEPGDFIDVHGIYNSRSEFGIIDIFDGSDNILIHILIKPGWQHIYLNSRFGGGFGNPQYDCELPKTLQSNEDFVMRIVMMDELYKIFVNGVNLSHKFPYRAPISTSKYIVIRGTDGFKWNKFILPRTEKAEQYKEFRAFQSSIEGLKKVILKNVVGQSLLDVKSYASSTQGSLDVFQWWLKKQILENEKGGVLQFGDETVDWILANREALEMFMTSGDIKGNKYQEALEILRDLIQEDPAIKEEALRLRLAVATAIVFSSPVDGFGFKRRKIDWMSRYHTYMRWSQEGILYSPFYEGTAWHLRFVVHSRSREEEHLWVRENTPEGFDNPNKIGDACHQMISYKMNNDDGVSIHPHTLRYYYYVPINLKAWHDIGGVCGSISTMAAGMCHAYGVPAATVGQPGHCAYVWYRNGNWQLGNSVSDWAETFHGDMYMGRAYFFPVMNEAQKNLEGYRLSEKMRIISRLANPEDRFEILEDATTECPYNFAVWLDLEGAIDEPNLQKETVQNVLLPTLLKQQEKETQVSDIAREKVGTSECFGDDRMKKLLVGLGSVQCKDQETFDFEVDLGKPSTIKEVKIKWIGFNRGVEYGIYALGEDSDYVLVRTHKDEKVEGWWYPLITLDGWDMTTTKIKFHMTKKGGRANSFAITKLIVMGVCHDFPDDMSKGKPVKANPGSSDPVTLVDGTNSTIWNGNSETSWFEINLKRICALDDIEFFWVDGAKPENVKVVYKVGSGQDAQKLGEDPFEKVPLSMDCGTTVRVEMSGGNAALKGVKACGISHTAKNILKMKVSNAYKDFYNVEMFLYTSINNMTYED
ncbi:uncharacterized protein LOC134819090 [Bolinopsis microptera]|uniref:uncharacterized protein LOC134819090 n=1 Tax=Bolinopsis microptera TaxID=2820187 RepID=UPI00307A6F89